MKIDNAVLVVRYAGYLFLETVTAHYVDFKGRASRRDFWTYVVVCLTVLTLMSLAFAGAQAITSLDLRFLALAFDLALLLPTASIAGRRLHDIGMPGQLVWVYFLPLAISTIINTMVDGGVGPLLLIILFAPVSPWIRASWVGTELLVLFCWFRRGVVGPNAYGPDPRADMHEVLQSWQERSPTGGHGRRAVVAAIAIFLAVAAGSPRLNDLRETLRCMVPNPDAAISACTVIIETGRDKEEGRDLAFAFYNRGNAYFRKGAYDRAVEDFSQAIRLDPERFDTFLSRGAAYAEKGDFSRAIEDYNQIIRLRPNDFRAFYNRARAYAEKQEYDHAVDDYDEAIRLSPNFALAFVNRAKVYEHKREYDRAIEDLDQAIRLDPKSALAFNNRGFVYFLMQKDDLAIHDYDQAIRLDPSMTPAFVNRGLAYGRKGQHDRAIEGFDQLITLHGNDPRAFALRGDAYANNGQYELAVQDYDRAIDLNPLDANFYNSRCYTLAQFGKAQEAVPDCDRSLTLRPDFAAALDSRGYAYFRLGKYQDAIRDYDAALLASPRLVESLYGRGVAKLKMGDATGVADISAAESIDPSIADKMAKIGVK